MDSNRDNLQSAASEGSPRVSSRAFWHVLAEGIARVWRLSNDRQAVASLLGRYSAHLGILVLVLLLVFLGGVPFNQMQVAQMSTASTSELAIAEPVATPTAVSYVGMRAWQATSQSAIPRKALPYTTIPQRVRLGVITYTVQPGDTVFGIAEDFGLAPSTIVWSNVESLQGAPWMMQPGITLDILPVDGAYHVVGADEALASIAETYEVEPVALYNMWNAIEPGDILREGQFLVIPDGVGIDFEWEPPPPEPASPGVGNASYSYGSCGDVNVSGPGANGWFILPTGSYSVSGYYFGDPRNPRHGGLDYRCSLGDPIYGADNGVVVYAGWATGYGNLVRIHHGNGYETYYAHLDSIWVGCGQPVYQGNIIGVCGTTGWSTGPHLHYEIRYNGVPQNPQLYEP